MGEPPAIGNTTRRSAHSSGPPKDYLGRASAFVAPMSSAFLWHDRVSTNSSTTPTNPFPIRLINYIILKNDPSRDPLTMETITNPKIQKYENATNAPKRFSDFQQMNNSIFEILQTHELFDFYIFENLFIVYFLYV